MKYCVYMEYNYLKDKFYHFYKILFLIFVLFNSVDLTIIADSIIK